MNMEIGDIIRVKETGQRGELFILEGCPPRIAWVGLFPGADGGYRYMRLATVDGQIITETLNTFNISEIEKDE